MRKSDDLPIKKTNNEKMIENADSPVREALKNPRAPS